MARIPVNPASLPTEQVKVPENVIYTAIIKELNESDKLDKNGDKFLKLRAELIEPNEWRGKTATDNWIPINDFRLGRLMQSCGHKHDVPEFDTDDLLGESIYITVTNEEFPAGSGRFTIRVNDYLTK